MLFLYYRDGFLFWRQIMTSTTILIIVIGSILLMVSVGILLAVLSKRRRQKEEDQRITNDEETIPRGTSGERTFEDVTYHFKHFRGTDKAPPYFSITIPCVSSGAFKIALETKFDRFFKRLGVCVEIETHDPEFDDTFYITTDTIPFTRACLEKSENRQSIKALFALGFNNLKHDGKSIVLTWQRFPRKQLMAISVMEQAAALVVGMGRNLEKVITHKSDESRAWKSKRLMAFVVTGFLLVSGITALIAGLRMYKPLDPGKIFLGSLVFSLPLLILFTWTAINLLRGRSSSHRELITVFLISLFAFPLAGYGYRVFFNGALDDNPASVRQAEVIRKYWTRNKNSTTYYAVVESWRLNRDEEKLRVSKGFYDRIRARSTAITVATKPGRFGYEWIVSYH